MTDEEKARAALVNAIESLDEEAFMVAADALESAGAENVHGGTEALRQILLQRKRGTPGVRMLPRASEFIFALDEAE